MRTYTLSSADPALLDAIEEDGLPHSYPHAVKQVYKELYRATSVLY